MPKKGSGPHNAGQATKVYDHRVNGKPVSTKKTSKTRKK